MLHDKEMREPLFEYLDELYPKNRIIEEKQMGKSRADVVMITPEALYGIEIKSDADTYVRLERQVKDYNKFYDYNYIVVGSSHAHHVEEHVPAWWGIIVVEEIEDKLDFYRLRKPERNPTMKWKWKIRLLWRPEIAHIQELNHMPKYKEKSKDFVRTKLLEKVSEKDLQLQLCEELMQRDYSIIAEKIATYKAENKK